MTTIDVVVTHVVLLHYCNQCVITISVAVTYILQVLVHYCNQFVTTIDVVVVLEHCYLYDQRVITISVVVMTLEHGGKTER